MGIETEHQQLDLYHNDHNTYIMVTAHGHFFFIHSCIAGHARHDTHPIPSWMDGLGVAGTADGFLEGGRFMYPDSDKERCRIAGGRDPRELKRRTATSFSEKKKCSIALMLAMIICTLLYLLDQHL